MNKFKQVGRTRRSRGWRKAAVAAAVLSTTMGISSPAHATTELAAVGSLSGCWAYIDASSSHYAFLEMDTRQSGYACTFYWEQRDNVTGKMVTATYRIQPNQTTQSPDWYHNDGVHQLNACIDDPEDPLFVCTGWIN